MLLRRTFLLVLFQPKHDAEGISMARDYLTVIGGDIGIRKDPDLHSSL